MTLDPILNPAHHPSGAPASPQAATGTRFTDPFSFYQSELSDSQAKLKALQQKIRQIASLRLLVGVGIIISIYRLFRTFGATNWWLALIILIICFILLFRKSGDLKEAETYELNRKDLNEKELLGLKGDFESFDGGSDLVTPDHPYAYDLDLFGDRSLFQSVNRSVTLEGRKLLARYLAAPELKAAKILERQSITRALQEDPYWCQQFLITGRIMDEQPSDREGIEKWLAMPGFLYQNKTWTLLLKLLPGLTILGWAAYLFALLPAWPAVLLSLLQLGITGNQLKKINESHQLITSRVGVLKKYHHLVALFLSKDFKEQGLDRYKTRLATLDSEAGAFSKLLTLINSLDNRLNIIMGVVLNALLLWDLNCLIRIEKWKLQFSRQFPVWMEISSELDALISLAIFNFNHPDYSLPIIVDEKAEPGFVLEIQSGRHPLLYPQASVPNDIQHPSTLNLFLITGANMAGKSTFLRMVGLNMVLAMAGAHVAASAMKLTPVMLYTSMRTNDSLFKNSSFFHAELQKLQTIMDKIRAKEKIYIMLDEILKGTNSRDQHLGSAALIKNIITYQGRGLIATHDIELTQLSTQYPTQLKNIAFEIDMDGEEMIFSYQYREGVCQNMNASILMRQMGIT